MRDYGINFDTEEEIYYKGGSGCDVIILTNIRLIVVDTCRFNFKRLDEIQQKALWETLLDEIDVIKIDYLYKYIKVKTKGGRRKSIDLGVHQSQSQGMYPSWLEKPFKKALSESKANVDQLASEGMGEGCLSALLPVAIVVIIAIVIALFKN